MKKPGIFIVSVFLLAVITESCKKDYSCRCTGSYLGVSADTVIHLGEMKKKEAKDKCTSLQTTYSMFASIVGASIDCEIE